LRDFFGVPEDGVFDDNDDDTEDTCSTCDSVYSVGEVSTISDEEDTFTGDRYDDRGLLAVTEIVHHDKERDKIEADVMVVQGNEERYRTKEDYMITIGQGGEEINASEGNQMETSNQPNILNGEETRCERGEMETTIQGDELMDGIEVNEIGANIQCNVQSSDTSETMQVAVDRVVETHDATCNPGFVLVIDNIDMNIRRSDQRVDRTTSSYHFCHAFALLNRVNSTLLEDNPISGVLSLDQILPSRSDLDMILEEFQVFVSRYSI